MEASIWFSFYPNKADIGEAKIDISISMQGLGNPQFKEWYEKNEVSIKEEISRRLDFIMSGD